MSPSRFDLEVKVVNSGSVEMEYINTNPVCLFVPLLFQKRLRLNGFVFSDVCPQGLWGSLDPGKKVILDFCKTCDMIGAEIETTSPWNLWCHGVGVRITVHKIFETMFVEVRL